MNTTFVKHTVRIELEVSTDADSEETAEFASYLLAPVIGVLETQGLSPCSVEMFNDNGEYVRLLEDMIQDIKDCEAE